LCTYIAVSLRRQMAPQQSAKFRTAFFGLPSLGAATRFANLRWKFSKIQKKSAPVVPNTSSDQIVVNFTHVHEHMRVTVSCRYALSPMLGRCLWFLVCFFVYHAPRPIGSSFEGYIVRTNIASLFMGLL